MVAYNFKPRFWMPIQRGTKTHTIRGNRKRHARPGELVQLYGGMRTRDCFKLIPDPCCRHVEPITIRGDRACPKVIYEIAISGVELTPEQQEAFAIADGFDGLLDMATMFGAPHGKGHWDGFLISWGDAVEVPSS